MKSLVILSLLLGWLIAEIKDFLGNGGMSNNLAYCLLKIIFILVVCLFVVQATDQDIKTIFNFSKFFSPINGETPGVMTMKVRKRSNTPRKNRFNVLNNYSD